MYNILETHYSNCIDKIPRNDNYYFEDYAHLFSNTNNIITLYDDMPFDQVLQQISKRSPLKKDEINIFEGAIRNKGMDILAFYKSRRFRDIDPFPGKWGIFYLDKGILYISHLINNSYPGFTDRIKIAHSFLQSHERYHFKFDFYALTMEASLEKSLYCPLKRLLREYPDDQVEESLANLDVWNWSKTKQIGLEDLAFDFMKVQPVAYRRFDDSPFKLQSELAYNLFNLDRGGTRDDQANFVGLIPESLSHQMLCPEYFYHHPLIFSYLDKFKLPQIDDITVDSKVQRMLKRKYPNLQDRINKCIEMVKNNPTLYGLRFKRWKNESWSFRVSDNFRAHIKPSNVNGIWILHEFGSHTDSGHG